MDLMVDHLLLDDEFFVEYPIHLKTKKVFQIITIDLVENLILNFFSIPIYTSSNISPNGIIHGWRIILF